MQAIVDFVLELDKLKGVHRTGPSWRENGISHERVVRRIRPPTELGCPALWEWLAPRMKDARERG